MASFELVVQPPAAWEVEQADDLVAAVAAVLDRFPGSAIDVRPTSPGLLAEVDQLKAAVRDTNARLDRAEVACPPAHSPVMIFLRRVPMPALRRAGRPRDGRRSRVGGPAARRARSARP